MLIAYDTINHKYIDLSTNYYTDFVHKLFNLSTQNSIITPTYDTDFSISFDDTKINSSSVPIYEEENINIELDYNDNNNDHNEIIDVSDLSLTDDDNDLIDFDNNTFELTFSDDDTNNNSNNIKII